jgi:hypothetical protein
MDERGRIQRYLRALSLFCRANIVDLSMLFGSRIRGIAGGIAAFAGLLAAHGHHDRRCGVACLRNTAQSDLDDARRGILGFAGVI